MCVRLSLSLSYSHRHKKIFRHKKNTDLPHKKKKPSTHMAIKKHDPSFQVGQLHWKHTCALGFPSCTAIKVLPAVTNTWRSELLASKKLEKKNLVPNLDNHGRSPHLFVHVSNLWKFGRQVRSSFFIVLLGFTFHNINITLF